MPVYLLQVKVHFNRNSHVCAIIIRPWALLHLINIKNTLFILGESADAEPLILELEVSQLNFENNILAQLRVEGNVLGTRLFNYFALVVLLYLETTAVIVKNDILVTHPL